MDGGSAARGNCRAGSALGPASTVKISVGDLVWFAYDRPDGFGVAIDPDAQEVHTITSKLLGIAGDPYDLERFVAAQAHAYASALEEIRAGYKRSHWMWFIFPQYAGLGSSTTSQHFAIKSVGEAEAYLVHPVLGPRLRECAEAAMGVAGRSAAQIFGSPDDMKLKSCATLFSSVSSPGLVFERLLDKYFKGERDSKTLKLIGKAAEDR